MRRFRLRWHHVHHVSLATIGLIALGVFFVLGVILRLAMGPVSLGPFSSQLREAVAQALPGLEIRYDDAALEWTRTEGRVNLIIVGARVYDQNRQLIVQAPKAEIGLAATPLLQGDVQIRRITLVGVQLTLVRTKDGKLHLGMERNRTSGDALDRIREAIEKSGNGPSTLERFAVSQARLAFYDEGSGLFLVAPNAGVDVANAPGQGGTQLTATVNADVEVTGRPAHVLAVIRLPNAGRDLNGTFGITGLQLVALSQNAKQFAFLQPFDLRTDISGAFVVEQGNRLKSADLGIHARGVIGGLGSPLVVKDSEVVARYDGRTGRLLIDDATLQGQTATAHAHGLGSLVFAGDGSLTRADLDLNADKIVLNMPDAFQQTVSLGGLSMRGSYATADSTLTLSQVVLSGSPLTGQLQGRVILANNGSPEIDLTGKLDAITVRDLVRYWPVKVGEGARAWIADNIPAGRAGPITFTTDIKVGELDNPSLPERALSMTIPIADASITYVRGMTLLTHTSGSAVLTGDTFKADIKSARVGPLTVTKAHVVIPELHKHGTVGDITATIQGSMRDLLTILDEKPLQYPTRFHIKPAETAGAATVDGEVRIPMVKDVGIDQIPIKVHAVTMGLALSLGQDTRLSNGNVVFDVDNTHLHAVGPVNYGPAPLNADWTEVFKSDGDITTHLIVRGTLDEQARAALKLRLGDFISGPIGVSAKLEGHRGTIRTAQATVDLTPATVGVDEISYHKPPGTAATAQVSARLDQNGGITAADLSLSGAGLAGQGTLNFSPEGNLIHAEFPNLRAGPANDFALSLTQGAANGTDIFIRGRSVDGTAVGKQETGPGKTSQESSTHYHVVAKLERMVLKEGTVLAPFNLEANAIGSRFQNMSLTTGMSRGDSVTASIAPVVGGRRLSVGATDAGALLKGMFGLSDISGGKLTVAATMPPVNAAKGGVDYAGTLTIRDFKIENQPFFARLFSAGSFGGLIDLMRGSGIVIDKLEMPFSAKNDVINIREAHANGPSVGLSAEGYIDRGSNRIDLKGAVAPIYGLNSVLGNLPLLGKLLVSKEGEGIVGMTYEASGGLDEPKIFVNPLSILTPGIFRRIFEGATPTAPSQAQNAAPKQAPH
ncbi:MAG TPA: AsmA-like C-terminal domain-containing protein [Rhizomicrobium sp.]